MTGLQTKASLADFAGGPSPQWLDLRAPPGGAASPPGGCGQVCVSMWLGPFIAPHETGTVPRFAPPSPLAHTSAVDASLLWRPASARCLQRMA